MDGLKLYDAEYRLVNIVWETEPVGSTELVKLCQSRLGWKKSTTYTVLRKLTQRGVLKNENAVVTALSKREEVLRYESEALLERSFGMSLPAFVASFLKDRKLTQDEAEKLLALIKEASK